VSIDGSVILHAVGDVSPRRVDYGEPAESLFAAVADKLHEADVVVGQLECNLALSGHLQYRRMPTWYGRAHPDNVKSLVHAGFTILSHASNHCFDYGPESLLETIDVLQTNGIDVVGVGRNLTDARRPVFVERNGATLAFLDYCAVLPEEYEARDPDKPGCAPIHVSTYYEPQEYQPGTPPRVITVASEPDVEAMVRDVRDAKANADIVVLSMHWGIHHIPEMLADYEFAVGHRAIDAGADLILGTHAHLVKGIEVYHGKVIFHNLGNFAQETPHHLQPPPGAFSSKWGPKYGHSIHAPGARYNKQPDKRFTMMVRCEIVGGQIKEVSFLPGQINDMAEPRFVGHDEPEFADTVKYISDMSAALGTRLRVNGDKVVVITEPE
jgi:poly-gamma-glutamate synthesis protein (capsule biosynthesis protein)